MTDWAISIPHKRPGESLVDVAAHCAGLPSPEREVAREIVLQARLDGVATSAGELIDHVASLQPAP
jgi:hypothetical protein